MKMIWKGWKINENCHVLVNQFPGNFLSKTHNCRQIKSVLRDIKWCCNASWGIKDLSIYASRRAFCIKVYMVYYIETRTLSAVIWSPVWFMKSDTFLSLCCWNRGIKSQIMEIQNTCVPGKSETLTQYWLMFASVEDGGPTLNQDWVYVLYLLRESCLLMAAWDMNSWSQTASFSGPD